MIRTSGLASVHVLVGGFPAVLFDTFGLAIDPKPEAIRYNDQSEHVSPPGGLLVQKLYRRYWESRSSRLLL